MIAVIDYGAGNLRNVCKALEHVNAEIVLTDKPSEIEQADKVVLPGVGAFADCMQGLQKRDLLESLMAFAHSGRPFLGICVGMQLLFDIGEEMGEWPGLGLIPGRVIKFKWAQDREPKRESRQMAAVNAQPAANGLHHVHFDQPAMLQDKLLPVPHIGWNTIEPCQPNHPILKEVQPNGYAYFVHSFHAELSNPSHAVAMSHYGYEFPAVVARDNVWGIQFHPEKSQDVGLQMLKNFVRS